MRAEVHQRETVQTDACFSACEWLAVGSLSNAIRLAQMDAQMRTMNCNLQYTFAIRPGHIIDIRCITSRLNPAEIMHVVLLLDCEEERRHAAFLDHVPPLAAAACAKHTKVKAQL